MERVTKGWSIVLFGCRYLSVEALSLPLPRYSCLAMVRRIWVHESWVYGGRAPYPIIKSLGGAVA